MTTTFNITILLVLTLSIAACNNHESAETKEHDHSAMESKGLPSKQSNGSVKIKEDKLNAIFEHYVSLTTALTNSNPGEANVASNAIEAGARGLNGGLPIALSAAKITSASNIEVQRGAYEKLSNEMIKLVKNSGVTNGEVYVEFCPMALDDKGAQWLSVNKEIRNPYFGDKMLTCGEVKETIK